MNIVKKLTKQREFFIFFVIVCIMVAMTIYSPIFLTFANLSVLFLSLSIAVIIAVGMTNLMVSGGFDMSVGSVLAFSGAMAGIVLRSGAPVIAAVLIGIVIGGLAGLFNGFVVSILGINPFVTTLASLSLFRGLTLIVTRGQNISGLPDAFNALGQKVILGLQMPIWYALILVVIGDILLRKSRFFRQNSPAKMPVMRRIYRNNKLIFFHSFPITQDFQRQIRTYGIILSQFNCHVCLLPFSLRFSPVLLSKRRNAASPALILFYFA